MKYLQSANISKRNPFKVCVVARTRRKLWDILDELPACSFLMGKEKRCGYVGFYYFTLLKEAIKLRKRLYNCKDLYVFLQDDRCLLNGKQG